MKTILPSRVHKKTLKSGKQINIKKIIKKNWQLYVMMLPIIIYLFIFEYMPMYGVQIAFKDYRIVKGFSGSEWVGFKHFIAFFDSYYWKRLLTNTVVLNIVGLVFSFPVPIILAILLNQVKNERCKKAIQTTIYIPHFISVIVLAGMIYIFLAPSNGIFNAVREFFGLHSVDLLADASAFRAIYILSGIWQGAGFGSILYIATLSGVDPTLYEAAEVDGASIVQKIRFIDLPSLAPTIIMQLILNCGGLLGSNTQKVLALQTTGNMPTSDVIGTYVYNQGLAGGSFSYASAIGLMLNLISMIMVLTVNAISKKVSEVAMF